MDSVPRNKLVVEHNDLVTARYDFSVLVHRLFVAGLLQIDRDDQELRTYEIPVRELVDAFDVSSNHYYSELKDTAAEIMKRATVGFEKQTKSGKRRFVYYPLFSKLEYQEGEGYIQIAFNSELKSQLLAFKGNFTQYEFRHVRRFSSQYSFRIYKWLKQIEDLRSDRTLSLEDMRLMLHLEDKYPNFAHFRHNVIDLAQRDLDEHADISFDYELKRKGRRVTHVIFHLRLSERTRRGQGPLFQAQAQLVAQPQPSPAMEEDSFDAWFEQLPETERARYETEAERRMQHSEQTGRVREAERWRHLRSIYEEQKSEAP